MTLAPALILFVALLLGPSILVLLYVLRVIETSRREEG